MKQVIIKVRERERKKEKERKREREENAFQVLLFVLYYDVKEGYYGYTNKR